MGPPPLGRVPLSREVLAQLPPQAQKQQLGEQLFTLIARHRSDVAGKITGMMLELDNDEILKLIHNDKVLKNKIDEAEFCDSDSLDCDVVEAGVLKARCVKTGHHVIINNRPCRVEKIGTSKVWKGPETGCFKTHLVARCIFTGKKLEHLCPATADVNIAAVRKLECTVMDIGDDGELNLLVGEVEKTDVNLPAETDDDRKLAERIMAEFHSGKTVVVQVMSACGADKVVEIIKHKCTD